MASKSNTKQSSKFKPVLIVAGVLVGLYFLLMGLMLLSDWNKIRPYKTLAAELNRTLGGGYKTSYNWRCELESTNCPSARMIKDANFKDNDEAKVVFSQYVESLKREGYSVKGISICEPHVGFSVYCSMQANKDGKVITINAKQNFIGIDIQS